MKTLHAFAWGCMFAAGAVMIADTASAQPARGDRPGPGPDFSLTYEQAKERWPNLTRERFDALDTNGDGVLTPADRIGRGDRPGRPGRPGAGDPPRFNWEGGLTFEQAQERWPNMTRERFDAIDQDGDGVLTREDFMAWREQAGRAAPGRPGPRENVESGEPEAKSDQETAPAPRRFERRPGREGVDGGPRWERGDRGEGPRVRGDRPQGEGEFSPRGDRRPRDGRGPRPSPAE